MRSIAKLAKYAVRRALSSLGYQLNRSRVDPQSYLGNVLKIIISELERQDRFRDFTFLQVGGFDGLTNDPIHEYIVRYRWRGVICEPQPEAFQQLAKTYSGYPEVMLENLAISSERGTRTLHFVPQVPGKDLPYWVHQLSTLRPDFITSHLTGLPGIEESVERKEVDCLTVSDILDKHGLSRVDLVQIDTEGYDFEVLKLIDFTRVVPQIIRFEHRHLSPNDKAESAGILLRQGYQLVFEQYDTIAFRL